MLLKEISKKEKILFDDTVQNFHYIPGKLSGLFSTGIAPTLIVEGFKQKAVLQDWSCLRNGFYCVLGERLVIKMIESVFYNAEYTSVDDISGEGGKIEKIEYIFEKGE